MYKPCLKLINILDRKSNNLGLFKLLLAVLIVWNHSFALASVGGKPHLILGNYTVALFGFISGILVSNSLIKNDSLARFVVRSGLRLYIPFSIAVIAGALLVAPTISNFSDLSIKDLLFYIRNCLTFNIQFNIPNVLVGHRNPHGINGSLWCMPLFFFMYALVASIYSIDQLKRNGIGCKVFFSIRNITSY